MNTSNNADPPAILRDRRTLSLQHQLETVVSDVVKELNESNNQIIALESTIQQLNAKCNHLEQQQQQQRSSSVASSAHTNASDTIFALETENASLRHKLALMMIDSQQQSSSNNSNNNNNINGQMMKELYAVLEDITCVLRPGGPPAHGSNNSNTSISTTSDPHTLQECVSKAYEMRAAAHQLRMAFYLQVEWGHRREVEAEESAHRLHVQQKSFTHKLKGDHKVRSSSASHSTHSKSHRRALDSIFTSEEEHRNDLMEAESTVRDFLRHQEYEIRTALLEALLMTFTSTSFGICVCDAVGPNHEELCFVRDVVPDGPADSSGVMTHDIIEGVEGTVVRCAKDCQSVLENIRPGNKVTFKVRRNGSIVMLRLTSAAPQPQPQLPPRGNTILPTTYHTNQSAPIAPPPQSTTKKVTNKQPSPRHPVGNSTPRQSAGSVRSATPPTRSTTPPQPYGSVSVTVTNNNNNTTSTTQLNNSQGYASYVPSYHLRPTTPPVSGRSVSSPTQQQHLANNSSRTNKH